MQTKMKLRDSRYNLYILPLAKRKMELYCELCQEEIGWLAYVEKLIDDKGYIITDCVLLKQKVHSATTELDPAAILELWNSILPAQRDKIKCWGHSHVNMSPTPSGQDNDQMKYFEDGNDWFIRIITNKKGELNIDFYDFKNGLELNMDGIIVYQPEYAALRTEIEAEIKEKVSKITYTNTPAATPSGAKPDYSYDDNYFKNKQRQKQQGRKSSSTQPLFTDITVKYLNSIEEALNDPNYWQAVAAY